MNKKVFISHSKLDKSIAELICTALENENIGCWIAPRDIPYGNDWAGEIASAIENSSLFIFVLSEHSNSSRQCPKEITVADNVGVPIVCVKIDDVEMSQALKYHLSTQQILKYHLLFYLIWTRQIPFAEKYIMMKTRNAQKRKC